MEHCEHRAFRRGCFESDDLGHVFSPGFLGNAIGVFARNLVPDIA
jgi:hypothetical protein